MYYSKSKSYNNPSIIFHLQTWYALAQLRLYLMELHHRKPLQDIKRARSYALVDIDDQKRSCSFSVDQKTLTAMVTEKNIELLTQLGGVKSIALNLLTNETHGISSDNPNEMAERKKVFGSNVSLKQPNKGFFSFAKEAVKRSTIIMLLVCAVLSIGFGIEQQGPKIGWYDGGSIIIATITVVLVSTFSNLSQSRFMEELYSKNSDIQAEVQRGGMIRQKVSIFDVFVGDIVVLKIGDQIPADGLFLDGHSLLVDESSIATESGNVQVNCKNNPFLFSGTKVTDGYGRMLVTSVGMNTTWGKMMSLKKPDLDEKTPLQDLIKKLTSCSGNIGLAVTTIVFTVLLIRYITGHTVTVVTMVAVAKSECLTLALTLTVTYSMEKMIMDNLAIVRNRSAFETIGSVTVICTNKNGILTSKEMSVDEFCLGKEVVKGPCAIKNQVHDLIYQAVSLNTTGSVCQLTPESHPQISGSPTEKAILNWAINDLGMDMDTRVVNQDFELLHVEIFKSEKKRSGIMARKKKGNGVQVHWKGGAEIILDMCSNYYDRKWMLLYMDNEDNKTFTEIIQNMASKGLRCIAFAHKQAEEEKLMQFDERGLTLLAIVGLKNPGRFDVSEAIEACRNAYVDVKMVTGDDLFTAKAIGLDCGIINTVELLHDKGVIIEGKEFRNWTHEERMQNINQIRIMARSSPSDKLLMVQCLKNKGNVVAVTGNSSSDVPALKEAHVGISMGLQGTQAVQESSGIVILDDNFASIVTVSRRSRCAYRNIQKILQIQLTTNIVSHIVSVVIAISCGGAPVMRPNNLIVDTLGSLALTTEPETDDVMNTPPEIRTVNLLITKKIWEKIIVQILFQVAILLAIQFKGTSIFRVGDRVKDTIVFNYFVLCQVFNQFNARNTKFKKTVKDVLKNKCFLGIVVTSILLQMITIKFLNKFENTKKLNWKQWGACVAFAAIAWPIHYLVKYVRLLVTI